MRSSLGVIARPDLPARKRFWFSNFVLVLCCVLGWQSWDLRPAQAQPAASELAIRELAAKAQAGGSVRVIVALKTSFQPEGELDPRDQEAQRRQIAEAQDRVLARVLQHAVGDVKQFESIPFVAMEVDATAVELLAADPDVLDVVEDQLRQPVLNESVPLIGAPAAWSRGFSGLGQTVAVLDSGVDLTHPFFSGKIVSEACYSTNNRSEESTSFCPNGVEASVGPGTGRSCDPALVGCDHGTHVAGIAAGTGGVARDATLIAVQVFSRFSPAVCGSTNSCISAYDSDIIRGLERVYRLRTTFAIAAANLSLGGGSYSSTAACDNAPENKPTKAIVDQLRSVGIATVVASGNQAMPDKLSAPACLSNVISVGATTKADTIAGFSNSTSFLSLLAPGAGITSSVPGGQSGIMSGTSMAAPHVAGGWAVLKSGVPSASVARILKALQDTGVPITDPRNGFVKRRIQLDAAASALGPTPTPTPTVRSPTPTARPATPTVRPATPTVSPTPSPTTGSGGGQGSSRRKIYFPRVSRSSR